ncbi:MAG: hypothetical protein HQL39_19690, partial [Alphaproteobacteria bacterium]|nr:hypothetical protein [Alphaproteobacteria bacterium]
MVRRVARAHGFLDPLLVLARLQRFAQPSEVAEPIELLRAGAVFHARGLLNSRVLQHNRDWVWPHWVERQFDPADPAFIPRAFSITHVNLTHRNWTAVGLPDMTDLPIVDPCGLVTPLHDGWSLDFWLVSDGAELLPSRAPIVRQRLEMEDDLAVSTHIEGRGMALETRVLMVADPRGAGVCRIEATARAPGPGWLVVALRPANPEGVSLVHRVTLAADRRSWSVDGAIVRFAQPVERHHAATYREGDVHVHLPIGEPRAEAECEVGMATAAALFALAPDGRRSVALNVPMPAAPGPS